MAKKNVKQTTTKTQRDAKGRILPKKTSGRTMQQLADKTTAEGLKAVKKPSKRQLEKAACAEEREAKKAAEAKLAAKIVTLRTEEKLSFRAIEQKLAKDLGLDPNRAFGGFVAFRLFNAAKNGDGKAAPKKAATKKAAKVAAKQVAKKTAAKKDAAAVETKLAPNGAQVIA